MLFAIRWQRENKETVITLERTIHRLDVRMLHFPGRFIAQGNGNFPLPLVSHRENGRFW